MEKGKEVVNVGRQIHLQVHSLSRQGGRCWTCVICGSRTCEWGAWCQLCRALLTQLGAEGLAP